jgi:hypothetical protein
VSVIVDLGVLEEDAELAIETFFDAFTVFKKSTGFVDEVVFLLLAEYVLFETLNWRYPGRFANESCDFGCDWLNLGENLDAG